MFPYVARYPLGEQNDPIEDNLLGQHCRKQYRRGGLELRTVVLASSLFSFAQLWNVKEGKRG